MSAEDYYNNVVAGKIRDSTLSMQMNIGFEPRGLLANYISDPVCDNFSVLLVLDSVKNVKGASRKHAMAYIRLNTEIPGPRAKEMLARRAAAVPSGLGRATDVVVEHADGGLVHDVDGNTFIDLAGGIGMLAVGHSPAPVVDAIKQQADKFIHPCALVASYEPYMMLDLRQTSSIANLVEAVRARPVPLPEKYCSEILRVDTIKFLADGGLSGATAALSIPYRHTNTHGTLRFDPEELQYLCQESHDSGWRIATHAIGDVAIDLILSIYESLGEHPNGLRHRIEHFGLPSREQLRRAAKIGVISVPQTIFLYALGGNFLEMVPDAFLPRTCPVRDMLDAGLTVALSSDAPVVEDDNPFLGMYAAILRRSKDGRTIAAEQGITAEEALYGYTMGGALAAGESDARGSIAVGKWADVAVLSANPLAVDPEALREIRVEMTFLAGTKVYAA